MLVVFTWYVAGMGELFGYLFDSAGAVPLPAALRCNGSMEFATEL